MRKTMIFRTGKVVTLLALITMSDAIGSEYSYKNEWVEDEIYLGSHSIAKGDTVQYGEFNGTPLYWYTKFWTQGDVPGEFGVQGGTSPWVLINSLSYDPNNSNSYEWVGWNGGLENTIQPGDAAIPTWRNGAEGAYTIIHDDIGAMKWNEHILPGLEANRKFPEVKVSWGVYVEKADDVEWRQMRDMVLEGHEMTCHSMNHTSAAEQWQWALQDGTVPATDPSIPEEIRGLTVVGFPKPDYSEAAGVGTKSISNELVTVTFQEGWGGGIVDPAAYVAGDEITVTPKAGVETITLSTGQKQYVKYTDGGVADENGARQGFISAVHAGWYEKAESPASWADNGGMTWFMVKIFCVDKWKSGDYKIQISDSKDLIDEKVYEPLDGQLGQFFPPNKRTDYYCYPYDAYSETTHDSIEEYGYVTARGGAKSGKPMPGDFFHPYRVDFDAFYMVDPDHATLYPENKHSLLTLQGMVDDIIADKGYMIRELHAVSRAPFESINDNSAGGWWGAITASLYEKHLGYCVDKINSNELTTYNASEVIKYRLTGNAVTEANLQKVEDTVYTLNVTADPILDKYKDDISVIVMFEQGCDSLNVAYTTKDPIWGEHPYRMPRKLNDNGTAWSINVNPYLGEAKILLNHKWEGNVVSIFDNEISSSSNAAPTAYLTYVASNQLSLALPAGDFKVDIFSANGQLIRRFDLNPADASEIHSVSTANIATGTYFINVHSASSGSILSQSITIK